MRHLSCAVAATLAFLFVTAQSSKIKPDKYPSLLWEIKNKNGGKPSYLFGTMHVSSKMVFNLSDSFYYGIKAAQIVALETNPGNWQEDFSRYDMEGEGWRYGRNHYNGYKSFLPQDYLSLNSFRLTSYEKLMEQALYTSPSIINSFLYRSNSEQSADFEEDTYLDLHIFQTGKKLGKKVCGVEDFDGSMQLVKEAYADAIKEKNKKERSTDYDEELASGKLEEAYRTGNLDLLDTINKVNSQSAAFDEKFLYRRNENQARAIDSILKTGSTLFVGVGAAHLPGNRGVIELLRRAGYRLRPIKMSQRDRHQKDAIEKLRVPVQFAKQNAADGFYSVSVPGKLYGFGKIYNGVSTQQFADMTNGSYYMVTRLVTQAALMGNDPMVVERKMDSLLYENIPGKILTKKAIVKNGYRGFDITARTRRGDIQRYNILITPFEVLIFKMSGNGSYVSEGIEAAQFFNSIQLKEYPLQNGMAAWKKFTPVYGGFEADMPQQPLITNSENQTYSAYDPVSKTALQIIRTSIYNFDFTEEDKFDLTLMEESFAASDIVHKQITSSSLLVDGYPAMDVKYQYKDSSIAQVRYIIEGPRYYTLVAHAEKENSRMNQFITSFRIKPFAYGGVKTETDTVLHFSVNTPVALNKKKKLEMYPSGYDSYGTDDDDSLRNFGTYQSKVISNDSTGEKIFISYHKTSPYYKSQPADDDDSTELKKLWPIHAIKKDSVAGVEIVNYEFGQPNSSRRIKGKSWNKDGIAYLLITETDSIAKPGAFITDFFESFKPQDFKNGIDIKKKKSDFFFRQFFSNDSMEHKKAIKNMSFMQFDADDFDTLKRLIARLNWKDKNYLTVKKEAIGKLADIGSSTVSDYLKQLYYAAGDTLDLQYAALETMLQQQTSYAYQTFGAIMQTDPPVLDVKQENNSSYRRRYSLSDDYLTSESTSKYSNGSFLDNLTDTLQLTGGIYKNLLPLLNINDYEESMLELTAKLLDSNLIDSKIYEPYLQKLILEAKQILKKQVIAEKAKQIEKAEADISNKKSYNNYDNDEGDFGNNKLSLYATLLLPYWNGQQQVAPFIEQLLVSHDKRLKYNTTFLLLRNKKPVPDSLISFFAADPDYRYELYTDLETLNMLNRFPVAYKNQQALAQSQLLNDQAYNKPDTIAFIKKVPVQQSGFDGWVYVFKYKEKKEDNSWKLATVGLLPKDETAYSFKDSVSRTVRRELDFTSLSRTKLESDKPEEEQIGKLIKKLVYSKRKSAAQFYVDDDRYGNFDVSRIYGK